MDDKIKVMVINDSRIIKKTLADLATSNDIEVVSTALNGEEALRKIRRKKPDVILLDLEMPKMDGFDFLEKLMKIRQIPVIITSSYSKRGTKMVFDALDLGAVDFLLFPLSNVLNKNKIRKILQSKIKVAARARPQPNKVRHTKIEPTFRNKQDSQNLVIIGSSTGGPSVVHHIISSIPSDFPGAIIVVQHMNEIFVKSFTERLRSSSLLKVQAAKDGAIIKNGVVLVAPANYHLVVNDRKRVSLQDGPKRMGVKPSINVTMVSASEVYNENLIGILLSGMGHDGAFGLKMIKKNGGRAIAQDEKSSVVFGMAKEAKKFNAVDKFVPAHRIPKVIMDEFR